MKSDQVNTPPKGRTALYRRMCSRTCSQMVAASSLSLYG